MTFKHTLQSGRVITVEIDTAKYPGRDSVKHDILADTMTHEECKESARWVGEVLGPEVYHHLSPEQQALTFEYAKKGIPLFT